MSKTKENPILLDCDGVICNFIQACLDYAKTVLPHDYTLPKYEEITSDVRNFCFWKDANLEKHIHRSGFCSSLPLIEGSQEFVEEVRRKGYRVIFLTSPYKDHQYWHYERFQWLKKHFSIQREDLIFATDKRFVVGEMFVDDHIRNILDWQKFQNDYNSAAWSVMMKQPWNEKVLEECTLFDCINETIPPDPNVQYLWHIEKQVDFDRTNNFNSILNLLDILK